MRVAGLTAPTLNFWVAKARGLQAVLDHRAEGSVSVPNEETGQLAPYQPSIDWSQAGPIIADEWFDIETTLIDWFGPNWPYMQSFNAAPLAWFMRAFVALKFGDEVENLPAED